MKTLNPAEIRGVAGTGGTSKAVDASAAGSSTIVRNHADPPGDRSRTLPPELVLSRLRPSW